MKKRSKNVSFWRYLHVYSGVKIPWFLLAATLIVIPIITNYMTRNSVSLRSDVIDASGNPANSMILHYIFITSILLILDIVGSIMTEYSNQTINLGVRQKMWRKMVFLPRTQYEKDRGSRLINRITDACESASSVFHLFTSPFITLYSVVLFVYQVFTINEKMAWYLMILLPVSAVSTLVMRRFTYWVSSKTMAREGDATSYLVERTRNLNLIRTAGTQKEEEQQGKTAFNQILRIELISMGVGMVQSTIVSLFFPMLVYGIILLVGSDMVRAGQMSAGDVMAFSSFSTIISTQFNNLFQYFLTVKSITGSTDKVVEVMEAEPENTDAGVEMDMPDTDITLQNVTFGYNDEKVVLDGITCTIPKGKVTAVIGANGSGKSTLFRLIERFYAPDQGAILLGDKDVRDYTIQSWRQSIGYVPQDCAVMEGTLRENITYGVEGPVSDEELWATAKLANLTELIHSLPDGFDTRVATGGRNFSGGQRQCIAIARAIMRDPEYLLLDEATSALDARSRRMVTDALHNLMKGRTTIMIAHDLASIRHADNVIVIKDGRVDACGSPDQIVKASEMYRQFVMAEGITPAG